MRAYFEQFEHPAGIIRITHDDALTHGKRTPYFWAMPAQIIKAPPRGVLSLHGAFGEAVSDEMRTAAVRCLYEEGFDFLEWERWKDGVFRKPGRVRVRALDK